MPYLIFVTCLWAFSFSLIGEYLAGQVDAYFSVLTRVALASLVFLPWLDWKLCRRPLAWQILGIGAVQLGLMYVFYYHAFLLLSVPEVLVFTITTPLYVTLWHDAFQRRFAPWPWIGATLAVVGAAIIRFDTLSSGFFAGFLVVQGSNLCFAFGQVAYKRLRATASDLPHPMRSFGFFHLGALIVACITWLLLGEPQYPSTSTQWGILIWLGVGASGAGYFLWNLGATRVDPGTLAIMNNVLIPAGLLVNLLLWNRDTDLLRLGMGTLVILASLAFNARYLRKQTQVI